MLRISLCLLLCFAYPAYALADSPALHRGLNLSSWLANAPRQPLGPQDFSAIRKAGFDHVRLPVNPEQMGFRLDGVSGTPDAGFGPVDSAVALAQAHHLSVILDIHTTDSFRQKLENDPVAAARFTRLWHALALRYQPVDPKALIFELLNEPGYYHREQDYQTFAQQLATTIHTVSPDRIIIMDAPHGASLAGLQMLKPLPEPHMIYSFHFYEPYMITHQGIHRGFDQLMLRYFRHVPYPASKVDGDAGFYAPDAPSPAQAQQELDAYKLAGWDGQKIAARVHLAHDWAAQNHAAIICGEFGVLRNHIDTDSRYRWIHDARAALEHEDIGWELWDYADLFGITSLTGKTSTDPVDGSVRLVDPQHGKRVFEPQALRALGLEGSAP
jgi:endoglucanase